MWKSYKYGNGYVTVYIQMLDENKMLVMFPKERDKFMQSFSNKMKAKNYIIEERNNNTIIYKRR